MTAMKLWKIIVAVEQDRKGYPIDPHSLEQYLGDLRHYLLKAFGGYTLTEAEGGWMSGHRPVIESCLVLDLATEKTAEEMDFAAVTVGKCFSQKSVMLVSPSGDVTFPEPVYADEVVDLESDAVKPAA